MRGVNRLIKEVESEYSVFKTYNILAWFENLIKITFLVYIQKWPKTPLYFALNRVKRFVCF